MKMTLALVSALGLAGAALAQQPTGSPPPPYVPAPTMTQPAPVIHYHVYSSAPTGSCDSGDCNGRKPLLKNWFRCGEKCEEAKARCDAKSCSAGKRLGDFGCGSWRLDCRFIFGSCHDFFEEPCRRQEPLPSWRKF